MLIIFKNAHEREDCVRVERVATSLGGEVVPLPLDDATAFLVTGAPEARFCELYEELPGVACVVPSGTPLRHVARRTPEQRSVVYAAGRAIGGGASGTITLVAGPCAVEDEEQLIGTAHAVAAAGADFLRGGAYKPRTSPYHFQGLGQRGLQLLARAREATGLGIITEVVDESSLALVEGYADVIQIGARNMQNFELLKRAGRSRLPVLLKRGMAATLEDWLLAAEYLLDAGSPGVVLCERGIRTFSAHSRYTLDLSVVPVLARATHLPVLVDPSHASGHRDSVAPLARAAIAVGADGVMIEVHPDPLRARCDGPQSITPPEFAALATGLRELAAALARRGETVR